MSKNEIAQSKFNRVMNILATLVVVVCGYFAVVHYMHHDDPRYNAVRYLNNKECHVVSPKGVEDCSVYTKAELNEFPLHYGDYNNEYQSLANSHL